MERKTFVNWRLGIIFMVSMLLGACGGSGGSDNTENADDNPPQIASVQSSVLSDTDNAYPTGRLARIDIEELPGVTIVSGTIQITSVSQGYDSGVQPLKFGSIFFEWDTTGLNPAADYVVDVQMVDANGEFFPTAPLTITLAPNPPVINKLISEVDLIVQANGFPVTINRSYLLDSIFDGPMGYGWTHNYRMRVLETPTKEIIFDKPSGNVSSQRFVTVEGSVFLFNADGTGSIFQPNGDGTYQSSKGDFRTLIKASDGTYNLKGKSGSAAYQFDVGGKLSTVQDRNRNIQTLEYDAGGKVTTITDASGQVTTFAYNAASRIISITDPAGRSVAYSYDITGNLTSTTNIGGFTTTYAYDSNHNLTSVTDPAGTQTFYTVGADDRLASLSDAVGENSLTFQYGNPAADKMTVTDALGNKTISTFGNNASVTQVVDPSGNVTQMTYDADLNLASLTSPNGGILTFTYNALGNLLASTNALGDSITLTYEPLFNQVTNLSDGKGNVTAFDYDAVGNLTTMTYPDGSVENYTYDAIGNLVSKTNRNSQTISFAHDSESRLTGKFFPDGSMDTFTYDTAGNLVSATDENGTINFAYDTADRLSQVNYPGGEIVAYVYDAAGNRTRLTYPDGRVLDYKYDALGRMTHINSAGQMIAQYTYDALSRVTRRELHNGTFSTYSYDTSSRLLDLINSKSSAEIISKFSYTYDNMSNRTSMVTMDGTTNYIYDQINRLLGVVLPNGSNTNFNFDNSGNRISVVKDGNQVSYTTNNLNQYSNVGGDRYLYDTNGNMTRKTTPTGTTTYSYDFENQLVQVQTPSETVFYTYDPFSRRTSKITSNGTIKYIHDGSQVIMEYDASDTIQASYIYGMGIDEVLIMERNGTDYFYTVDGQGSVTNLTDLTQNVTESYTYDVYGTPRSTNSVSNPYLYTGREFESELGIYFYRARYYDPELGRFIATDPISYIGGLNLYSYVKNNPINYVDPSGLARIAVANCLIIIRCSPHRHIFFDKTVTIGGQTFDDIGFIPTGSPFGSPGTWLSGENINDYTVLLSNLDDDILAQAVEEVGFNKEYCMIRYDCTDWEQEVYDKYKELAGDGVDTDGDGIPDDRDNDDDNDGIPDDRDPDPKDPTNPSCNSNPTLCAPDPTFVQVPSHAKRPGSDHLISRQIQKNYNIEAKDLIAKIKVPYENALVRADIPIYGQAYGKNFASYRVEYSEGSDPSEWITIALSSKDQQKEITPADLDDTMDTTIRGNLATWDTGLRNYVYLPSHPADHPVNLKGTYTIRLVVTGKDGKEVEDRVTVDVANVIPNAWGGFAKSTDGKVYLSVPEQALRDSFRLIGIQATTENLKLYMNNNLVGKMYAFREPGEVFSKPATITMAVDEEALGNIDPARMGIYGFDEMKNQWDYVASWRNADSATVSASVSKLHHYYALMATDNPAEGSVVRVNSQLDGEAIKVKSTNDEFLVKQNFEIDMGDWSNRDGDVGASVTLEGELTSDDTRVLKITNTNISGNFAVNVMQQPFDASEYPVVQFDYRIPAEVKTNFLVKVTGRWYEIGFTDDKKELHNKRVNIAHIGNIEDVVTDDRWHTAQFDLYEMLRARTGNTLVEEMIMVDWDVGGYMKLQYGKNKKGATYYIDNFSISREVDANPGMAANTIVVDDFNQQKENNNLGGATIGFADEVGGTMLTSFENVDNSVKGYALGLSYDVAPSDSYAGYISALQNLDLREYQTLSFLVKGDNDIQNMQIGLKDYAGNELKVSVGTYFSGSINNGWQKVTVPLVVFTGKVDMKGIDLLSLAFESHSHTKDQVLIDNIEFEKNLDGMLVDNFEHPDNKNAIGKENWTFASGLAAINGQLTHNSPNGIYRLSYGGNIGVIKNHDGVQKSFAGWGTSLGGVDCSSCDAISFRLRGAKGGENATIYLGDGNFRWGDELRKFGSIKASWQDFTIPLNTFSDYGVDLTHLDKFEFVFEGKGTNGTIYLDDIRLVSLPD